MNQDVLNSFVPREHAGSASYLFTYIPTIRVLIYTDDPVKVRDVEDQGFNIRLMKNFQGANQPAFARVEFELLSRNVLDGTQGVSAAGHAKEKLTGSLLIGYHEVWFFGLHLSNLTAFDWNNDFTLRGGPESELTDPEVDSLRKWMGSDTTVGGRTGGVLITGDHSVNRPANTVPNTLPTTLSLGRALSRRVPRAHQLRTWEGGPTGRAANSFNTQEPNFGCDLDDQLLEGDPHPQKLILPRVDGNCPHKLFIGKDGKVIDVFPDHNHEGELLITDPTTNPPDSDWPTGGPEPTVVAYGTDKRKPVIYKLLAVYDGDMVGVGRIAADSTWHHYFNDNLRGFANDMTEGSVANRVGQFYTNLAVWLSPLPMRQTMARAMFWWLANHPRIAQEAGGGVLKDVDSIVEIGSIARTLLASVAAPSEIHALLSAYAPAPLLAKGRALNFPSGSARPGELPSQELVLGSIISSYYPGAAAAGMENAAVTDGAGDRASAFIKRGLADAFKIHAQELGAVAKKAQNNHEEIDVP